MTSDERRKHTEHLAKAAAALPPSAWLAAQLDPILRPYGTPGQAVLLLICVPFGAVLYALASFVFRSDEMQMLWRLLRKS